MRYVAVVLGTLLVVGAVFFARGGGKAVAAATGGEDANKTARQFTPWLTSLVHGKQQVADQYFHLRPAAQNELNAQEVAGMFNQLSQVNAPTLNLVWSKSLGDDTGIVMFTAATEDGPIGFKIYYYGFNNQMYISHVQMTRHWSEIERLAFNFDPQTGPVATVPMNGADGN